MQQHPGEIVTNYQFVTSFHEEAMVRTNIVSGFRKCGVYPFNPDAIVFGTPDADHENATTTNDTILC